MENSKIENLDLIRAKHAYEATSGRGFGGADGGEVVKKLPPLIRENGFLGTLAYALSSDKKNGYANAFDVICEHLRSLKKVESGDAASLMDELIHKDSLTLRDVTTETLLYLDYLRRFATKDGK